MSDLQLFSPDDDSAVKGFALTPTALVDLMVAKLFAERVPAARDRLLDPGCGTGEFIEGVIRWCKKNRSPLPSIVGVEQHSGRATAARDRFRSIAKIEIRTADFLRGSQDRYDFIIGNPPYVAITGLSPAERIRYRRDYETATGRFDLYMLFFEQAVGLLADSGRLVFVTPEKYLYVDSAAALRTMFATLAVRELHFLAEDSFDDLVTYPIITTVVRSAPSARMQVLLRDGVRREVRLPKNGDSWLPALMGARPDRPSLTLEDACTRISCGVATGADSVFVVPSETVTRGLRRFAHDTISGRELVYGDVPIPTRKMLVPYDADGRLLEESEMGDLLTYLREPARRARLRARTCVATKPWYSFHETPPLREFAKVKLLCKDIGSRPHFALDHGGRIVPRHSTYFAIPAAPEVAADLCKYLNSVEAQRWLGVNCQRAANGFLRLQSTVLKRMPLPAEFVPQNIARPTSVVTVPQSA